MELSPQDKALIAAIEDGLPLVSHPYEAVGNMIGLSEIEVIDRLENLIAIGVVSRFGVVVNHRQVGYRANAMVVWDIPDDCVADAGRCLAELSYVSLSYQRPRRLPDWPYNLFCMIHGREQGAVESLIEDAAKIAKLADVPRAVLFSGRQFKQRGAKYSSAKVTEQSHA
tara:strand:- start:1633 stop:2139 length:507 start_codon:yes stop_codon:yes gene_type:complete